MNPEQDKKNDRERSSLEEHAFRVTRWIGSVPSLVIHTTVFAASFAAIALGVEIDRVLLVLTTAVSLEAIYLAIFIQMSVNRNTQSLHAVEQDVDEITEDIDEIQKDVDEIQEDVDEITEDIDEIQKDVDEISEDVNEDEADPTLARIEGDLRKLLEDFEKFRTMSQK